MTEDKTTADELLRSLETLQAMMSDLRGSEASGTRHSAAGARACSYSYITERTSDE